MRHTLRHTGPPLGGPCAWSNDRTSRQKGFTLVELVMVMMLIAVIAAFGAARFADREPFAVQGAADQLVSGLRLAQATAVAQRRAVRVVLSTPPAAMSVCFDNACAQPVNTPAGDNVWLADASDLTLNAAAAFSYLPNGSTTLTAPLVVVVRGGNGTVSSPAITVEPGSGHAHLP